MEHKIQLQQCNFCWRQHPFIVIGFLSTLPLIIESDIGDWGRARNTTNFAMWDLTMVMTGGSSNSACRGQIFMGYVIKFDLESAKIDTIFVLPILVEVLFATLVTNCCMDCLSLFTMINLL
jgi:hypothetical protein